LTQNEIKNSIISEFVSKDYLNNKEKKSIFVHSFYICLGKSNITSELYHCSYLKKRTESRGQDFTIKVKICFDMF